MEIVIADDVQERLKGVQVASAIIRGCSNTLSRPKEFYDIESEVVTYVRRKYSEPSEIARDSRIRVYRDFYWKLLGLDPTKIRPANEALIRRVVQGESIPSINLIVDLYNLASLRTGLPMSAYDLNKVKGERLLIRYADKGEVFHPIGGNPETLTGNELVISDSEGPISIYPYRDCLRTRVDKDTSNVLLIVFGVPGIAPITLLWGLKYACKYITMLTGGKAELLL